MSVGVVLIRDQGKTLVIHLLNSACSQGRIKVGAIDAAALGPFLKIGPGKHALIFLRLNFLLAL
jgi:hypothetical protein